MPCVGTTFENMLLKGRQRKKKVTRRRKQLLDDLQEETGHFQLKEEAILVLEESMDLF
jgi:Fe2+ or Zn2+ uptake regulation protein